MPGDSSNDAIIAQSLAIADVVMLPGNGVFAIGDSVEQAYLRLELVEHLAKIYYYAEGTNAQPMTLAPEHLSQLLAKRASLGLGPKFSSSSMPEKSAATNDESTIAYKAGEVKVDQNSDVKEQTITAMKMLIADEIRKIVNKQ